MKSIENDMNNANKFKFSSYKQYLLQQHQDQIKQLRDIKRYQKQSQCNTKQGTEVQIETQKDRYLNQTEKNQQITVISGKLVYLQKLMPNISTNTEIKQILRENGIKFKDYLYGNQSNIIKSVIELRQKQQNEVIDEYINKNMIEKASIQIEATNLYNTMKNTIFDD